ncbi:MAG TPA: hypothetical protein VGL91_23425 [Acidobacteriota bacterium]
MSPMKVHVNLTCRHCNNPLQLKQHSYTLTTESGDEDMKLNAYVCGNCGYTEFVNARISGEETVNYTPDEEAGEKQEV